MTSRAGASWIRRRLSAAGVGLGTAVLVLAPLAPATASDESATPTYQGTWYEATAGTCTQVPVTGRWSITFKRDGTASVSVTMFMDDQLHAAWGGNALGGRFSWARTDAGYDLALADVTLTIRGDRIRFDIPNRYPTCDAYALGTVSSAPTP